MNTGVVKLSFVNKVLKISVLGLVISTLAATSASAYVKIGGRFTQDPLNKFYYNGTGTAVKSTDEWGNGYYFSHWLEVGHAMNDWNNTQNTKVWFTSTSNRSDSILDIVDTSFPDLQLWGQTSMWNGNTQLSVAQTHSTYWYWALVELNSNVNANWMKNSVTEASSQAIAVGKIRHNAAHEIGHALGLDHLGAFPWNESNLMYPNPTPYYKNGIVGPTSDEVSGVQEIYGKRT